MLRGGTHHLQAVGLRGATIALHYLSPVQPLGMDHQNIRPAVALSKSASTNFRHAFPETSVAERVAVINAVWDNFGRVVRKLHGDKKTDTAILRPAAMYQSQDAGSARAFRAVEAP
jgi:hypothetical protein